MAIKLTSNDWEILFSRQKEFKIGNTILTIKPPGIAKLSAMIGKLAHIFSDIQENLSGDIQNLLLGEKTRIDGEKIEIDATIIKGFADIIPTLTNKIQHEVMIIIAELSGLDVADVKRLPPVIVVDLLSTCFDLIRESQEDFFPKLKNLVMISGQVLANNQDHQKTEQQETKQQETNNP